ncbi:helix-turn-helix domain-containing protein [Natrinema salaciae]|uniref:HTH DNA binding domain-containing protein n=1 Tax=Natrinema salaciae TaxID=1186196 RepID=A0A1H9BE89_9EURY|nr:helix-turn-helix domain-containing protein [Natrinema salaciae]SEP87330.1 HTH DNA binding domain-containing protein [Natrinema salaciae]
MKYLDVTIEMPTWARHPMQEFCRQSDAMGQVELITWNVTGEGEEYAFFRIAGDIDAYRDRIEAVESVLEYNLTPIDDDSFYSYVVQRPREAERLWRQAFTSRNLVVVPPIRYDEDVRMTLTVVGDKDDLRALLEEFPAEFELTVEEVGDYDRRHATIAAGLTERQLEAIEAAVELGYYAVPREASLEAVAEALGCAESTASNHLREAESRVMERLVRRTAPAVGRLTD